MFLKNRNIISKIRRLKVTDYAAVKLVVCGLIGSWHSLNPLFRVSKYFEKSEFEISRFYCKCSSRM